MGEAGPGEPRVDGPTRVIDCVGALVTDTEGRLLLIQRGHPPGEGLWSLPGGKVEPGESDAAALVREVAEETGLSVAPGPLVGTVRRDAPDGRVFDIRDLRATVLGGELRPGDDAADARWVTRAAYERMDAAGELVPGLTGALSAWDCLPRA